MSLVPFPSEPGCVCRRRERRSQGRAGAAAGRRSAGLSACRGQRAAVPQPEGQSCCSPPRSPALGWHSGGARGLRPGRGAVPESLSAGYVSPLSSLPPLPFPVYLSRSTHTHTHPCIYFFPLRLAGRSSSAGGAALPGAAPCPVVSRCVPVPRVPVPTQPWVPSPLGAGGRGTRGPPA